MKHLQGEKFNPAKSLKTMIYVIEHDTFDIYCNKCGCPVLTSEADGYDYQCMNCDEDLHSSETHKGKHHTDEQFNLLCLDTEALLSLDDGATDEEIKLAILDDLCNINYREVKE